ncbi:MAG TPA: hypothetical protein V6C86_26005 [Oculatellaceae cyanobacterium]
MQIYDADVADNLLFSPDSPELRSYPFQLSALLSTLIEDVDAKPVKASAFMSNGLLYYRQFTYKISRQYAAKHVALLDQTLSHLWQFDAKIDLDGYSVGDFREFWKFLLSRCLLHLALCDRSSYLNVPDFGIDNILLMHSRKAWSYEMSDLCGLPLPKVQRIISDLTYIPHQSGEKMLDVTLQPFIPLSNDRLCVSPQLISMSNAESNLWSLLDQRKKSVISKFKDEKEIIWLKELAEFCVGVELICVPFKTPEGHGDIDALVIDERDKFMLGVQLKWHQAADRINEVRQEVKEFNKGVKQAKLGLDWILSHLKETQLQIDRSVSSDFVIKAMVLSKNTTGGGRLQDYSVPIASDRLLKWVVGKPGNRTLKDFYKVASEPRRYMPKVGVHYQDTEFKVTYGGLNFHCKNSGWLPLEPWNPATDIDYD